MAKIESVQVPIEQATKQLQIRVRLTGVHAFQWRLYAAQKLLQLAGVVSPLPLEVEVVEMAELLSEAEARAIYDETYRQ
jgi:hypothetical protein